MLRDVASAPAWVTRPNPAVTKSVLVGPGGNQDLHYLLAWESLAEREMKWNKFIVDPEWVSKRAESERDGPIIASITNMFLQPTAFSAVK